MKVFVVLALCAVSAFGASINENHISKDIVGLVKKHGIPLETIEVTTEDGYVLDLFRLQSTKQWTKSETRPVVLLFHGFLSNAEQFVIGGPQESLAFYLYELGYDVFLGNARGTVYGQKHTSLNPKKDAAFWRFSWHDIGAKDLPAIVDKILDVTGQSRIYFVGHNEGTTASYVFLSVRPEYNDKIIKMVSMGPMAYMKHAENQFVQKAVTFSKADIIKHFGMSTFNPSHELVKEFEQVCIYQHYEKRICQNYYFLFNGYNSDQFNMTTIDMILPRVPSFASVREFHHYVQLKANGHFAMFEETDDKNKEVQDYDLNKITVPVGLLYTPEDKLSHKEDVMFLKEKLPHVVSLVAFEQFHNNLDLIYAKDVEEVYKTIVDIFETKRSSSRNML